MTVEKSPQAGRSFRRRLVPPPASTNSGTLSTSIEGERAEIGALPTFKERRRSARKPSAPVSKPRLGAITRDCSFGRSDNCPPGQGIDYPRVTGADVTHRGAAQATGEQPEALQMFAPELHEQEPPA